MTDAQTAAPGVPSSPATMRDLFPGYYRPSVDTIVAYLRCGLVAVDANVLLSLYRYTPTAREQLLGALTALGEGLWVPHEVAMEYQRNRLSVLREQQSRAADARKEVEQLAQQSVEKLSAVTNRAGVTPEEREALTSRLREVYGETAQRVETMLEEAARQPDNPVDDDPVRARLDQLLRVGRPLDDEKHRQALGESERRKKAKEPPGFKDTTHGDYLLWRQLINEAGRRRVPVVLITDDRKEDWQRIEHGRHLGAHPALVDEMRRCAGQPFVLLESRSFLRLAGEHLRVPVSAGTLDQASQHPQPSPSRVSPARVIATLDSLFHASGPRLDPAWLLALTDAEFQRAYVAARVRLIETQRALAPAQQAIAEALAGSQSPSPADVALWEDADDAATIMRRLEAIESLRAERRRREAGWELEEGC